MSIDRDGQLERIDYGDKVYFDAGLGIAGTTLPIGTKAMPSDVIADLITICTARNIRTIAVHGALTLGAAMEHFNFCGYEHYDIGDILDLSGEDVDGSHINGLIVTGAQGGTGFLTMVECVALALTLFAGRMNLCSFYGGAFSFRDADYVDLINCESIYGAVTITVQAPTRGSIKDWRGNLVLTAQDGGVMYVRGFKGTLEIDAMTAGALSVYANGADITINADCIGTGTINIYGNARVTDNHGAGTTVNDYTKETQLDTIFQEQADTAVNVDAILASETDVFDLNVADTRYIVRSLRLKCADPGADTVTVRLRELENDVSTIVATFDIIAANFATYFSLMDMFGVQYLAGDDLQVTVQASAAGPYQVLGQYSYASAT